ncbi:glucose-methanol-choline oxidoreductase [Fibrisoma limi BUZ 3]|uniref:Glucose-methanol-choline oxidoreductase n=1 Tax=Fibrisoma limi BUZ 3 TaxID=1185876 RepID=I2GFE5_9BACT|nr:GMC oxidoreductase [Fibrisoma limi]CCH52620.1 glucose-methanol-choline oxidoreductase [Fibrisoma limi BUZ 3]
MHTRQQEPLADHYDAIVVGSGISGGWSAKELSEKGLKVLLLERGRMIEHVTDYHTATKAPWEFPHRNARMPIDLLKKYPVQNRTGFAITEATHHHFVNDLENPYVEEKPFDWIRGYHVGGRSLMWGRYSFRFSDLDFEANAREGIATDWPIRYKDIAPWYDYVEKFAGIAGNRDGLPHLPDGQFQPPLPDNCLEQHFRKSVNEQFADRKVISARAAHITAPTKEQTELGRAKCQFRNMCMRGCPYGAYFSTQSATLPAARRTKNLTVRPHSIVNSIIYDEKLGKATGVRVIDEQTNQWHEFRAKIIFLNASALGSTFILLNSRSNRFPNGMDDSGQLGHNLMDHHFHVGANAIYERDLDKVYYGRHPAGLYIPRFRNLGQDQQPFKRGYGFEVYTGRQNWDHAYGLEGFGADFKQKATQFGNWTITLDAFGECLPYYDNRVSLTDEVKDKWGQPVLKMDVHYRENETLMRKDAQEQAVLMLEKAGFSTIEGFDSQAHPGLSIHEMGTARMGNDPKTSVFNKFNQHHIVKNVFCTDGACMTSSPCQNPSLTYMALSARAADYAVRELKKGNL